MLEGLEATWSQRWAEQGTYSFDRTKPRDQVYSIDTPPPTVSGSLHVGHVFSYTHTDLHRSLPAHARQRGLLPDGLGRQRPAHRAPGAELLRRALRPLAPLRPRLHAAGRARRQAPGADQPAQLHRAVQRAGRRGREGLRAALAHARALCRLVPDLHHHRRRVPAVSQRAFLRNLARGEAYQQEAPTLWDVTFQTAVAQAELEAREYPGAYHRVAFHGADGPVHIETTRPELIAACVALIAHPDDERYQALFGTTVRSPLFGVEVPVLAHPAAEMDKGAGIAMCCTFGDLTDVQWWRELQLPTRTIVGRDGRILRDTPAWITGDAGRAAYAEIAGKTTFSARELLPALASLATSTASPPRRSGWPTSTSEATSRSRSSRRASGTSATAVATPTCGRSSWRAATRSTGCPAFMQTRYTNWIDGLNGDWLVSRQRFFGVPFPVWYRLDADGEPDYDQPIVAAEAACPSIPPPGAGRVHRVAARPARWIHGRPRRHGHLGDVVADAADRLRLGARRRPVRPDVPDGPAPASPRNHPHLAVLAVVRAHFEHGVAPWTHAVMSGWVLDPDRKKMSKSKGNVVVPDEILDKYGADAVRWRAAGARPGPDSPFDEAQMKVGRRLAMKVLNASKFVLAPRRHGSAPARPTSTVPGHRADRPGDAQPACDSSSTRPPARFEAYDYATALEVAEKFFWTSVTTTWSWSRSARAVTTPAARPPRAAFVLALWVQLRLLAPFLPVRHRGGLVVVAGRLDPPRRVAGQRTSTC